MRRFRKGNNARIVRNKRLTLTKPPRKRKILFYEIKGRATAAVLISTLVPFNDPIYCPVGKWCTEVFPVAIRSKLGHVAASGKNSVGVVGKKRLRLKKPPIARDFSFLSLWFLILPEILPVCASTLFGRVYAQARQCGGFVWEKAKIDPLLEIGF